jgi:Uma2 family endonuclease
MGNTLVRLVERYPWLRNRVLPSLRVRVSQTRVRVPDICVLAQDAPDEQVPTFPPILCIEILSEEDGWIATPGLLTKAIDGILRAGKIEMPLAEVLE